jgi:hypothetical protein
MFWWCVVCSHKYIYQDALELVTIEGSKKGRCAACGTTTLIAVQFKDLALRMQAFTDHMNSAHFNELITAAKAKAPASGKKRHAQQQMASSGSSASSSTANIALLAFSTVDLGGDNLPLGLLENVPAFGNRNVPSVFKK